MAWFRGMFATEKQTYSPNNNQPMLNQSTAMQQPQTAAAAAAAAAMHAAMNGSHAGHASLNQVGSEACGHATNQATNNLVSSGARTLAQTTYRPPTMVNNLASLHSNLDVASTLSQSSISLASSQSVPSLSPVPQTLLASSYPSTPPSPYPSSPCSPSHCHPVGPAGVAGGARGLTARSAGPAHTGTPAIGTTHQSSSLI